MDISTIIFGGFSTTLSEYDTASRPKIRGIEYLTNTINNLELKCTHACAHTPLYT